MTAHTKARLPTRIPPLPTERAINKILNFLTEIQLADGSFEGFSGDSTFDFSTTTNTTFHTSLILLCLGTLRQPQSLIAGGVRFLLDQRRPDWSWMYWRRGTNKFPPPDFDDTACALAALSIHAPETLTGESFAYITQALTTAETQEGGPYNTWIVPETLREKWRDVDIVVNSNIAYFLSLHDIHLPRIIEHIKKSIDSFPSSHYYFSLPVLLYFISRSSVDIRNSKKDILQENLLALSKNGLWENDLETAMAVSTLIQCGCNTKGLSRTVERTIETAIAHLISVAERENWKAYPLYMEEHIGDPTYSGSEALTSAYILEALHLYVLASEKNVSTPTLLQSIHKDIIETTKNVLAKIPSFLSRTETYVTALTAHDHGNQITLLPYHFNHALHTPLCEPANIDVTLGSANLSGWLAYRIYDDLLDNGSIDVLLDVPLANIALRYLTETYCDLVPLHYRHIFHDVIDSIEKVHTWERNNAFPVIRSSTISIDILPDYGDYSLLADKSLGHTLGPLTILLLSGYTPDSTTFRETLSFFRHYLIARQLNDDAHDWQEDLKRGYVNSVAVELLQEWKNRNDSSTIDLETDTQDLQKIFWQTTIDIMSQKIINHIEEAREALKYNPSIRDTAYLDSLLTPLEQSAKMALFEKRRMQEFLESYC